MTLARQTWLAPWFSIAAAAMVPIGLFFAFAGLAMLPVSAAVLAPWQNGVYGAAFMGWGAPLFCAGRLAFRRRDQELMKALLIGLLVWFPVEALFSAWLGVWFNVGIDLAVLAILGLPLLPALRSRSLRTP